MKLAPWLLWLWLWTASAAADSAYGEAYRAPSESRVGECIGGDCTPLAREAEPERKRPINRRARIAFAGAVLGTVTAGLALGGSTAIAAVDHPRSERVTRGIFVGAVAVVPPLVAASAFVARRGGGFGGYRGVRSLGWTAYSAALIDGIVLWYGAFRDVHQHPALTVSAGVIAALALLPHALDALLSSRHAFASTSLSLGPGGIGLRF